MWGDVGEVVRGHVARRLGVGEEVALAAEVDAAALVVAHPALRRGAWLGLGVGLG